MKNFLKSLQDHLKKHNSDVFYLPSFDHYMSEYVPATDSLRVHLSGFKGSVAEALIPAEGKLLLYVDGRYHEQADLECDPEYVEVVKVPYGESLISSLKNDLKKFSKPSFVFSRTQRSLLESLENDLGFKDFISLDEVSVNKLVEFQPEVFSGSPWEVSHYVEVKEKLFKEVKKEDGFFINALDTLAYVSGLRAHFLPYQGTFRGVGFITSNKLWVFIEDHNSDSFESFQNDQREIRKLSELPEVLKEISVQHQPEEIFWDSHFTSAFNYQVLESAFSKDKLKRHAGFYQWHASKTEAEVQAFRDSFEKSDKAIYQGLCWLTEKAKNKEKVSELETVTVVAFGKQKKESIISSITSVDVADIQAFP
ncbi:MAG: aminopeptidase P family N-terminal domain-containing protein, partial [Halobacteriovoraceae bacterium]|nr:aminopeptidase P family N-terminal domain-containing protein [Halobacteriovoraceae bacterium]